MSERGDALRGERRRAPPRSAFFASPHPRGGLFARETIVADAAMLATVAAIAVMFAVSQITLEAYGYVYISPGGPFWQKVHPATPIAAMALGLRCLATDRPLATAARLMTNDAGALLYMTAVAITGLFAALVVKTPFTPLIDTFILPLLFFWLLRDLDERIIRLVAIGLAIFLALNAVVALAEFMTGWRLIFVPPPEGSTSDPTRPDAVFDWRASLAQEWRATAFLGHPIESGGIVGSFIICLAVRGCRWLPPAARLPLLGLQIVSMFAYGSRLALVLSVALAAVVGMYEAALALARGSRLSTRSWALIACAVPIAVAAVAIVYQVGTFDRTLDRFANDAGSATTRVTMFRLFEPLSIYDMLFGPNQDLVRTWQRLEGLEFGIESTWVGLALTYGLIVTSLLVVGLLAFMRSVARVAGSGTWLVYAFFLVAISISTAMSGKTTVLATVTVLILLFVRKDRRTAP